MLGCARASVLGSRDRTFMDAFDIRVDERRCPRSVAPLGWLHVGLLCLVTSAHWAPRLGGPIDLRYDAGVYYALGTSLAQGRGYRIASEPGEIEGVQYPPALPAWIALHQLALGTNDPAVVAVALRRSSFILSLVYALGCYALARSMLPARVAFLSTLLVVLAFHTLHLQDLCFTEIPFALVTVAFALALRARRKTLRALAPLLAALAFLLRTAGVALLAAWVLEAATRRDWRSVALRAVLSAIPLLAWQAHVTSVRSGPEYTQPAYEYQRAPYHFYNVTYAENAGLLDPFVPESGLLGARALVQRLATNGVQLPIALGEAVSTPIGFWRWATHSLSSRLPIDIPEELVVPPLVFLGMLVIGGLLVLWRRGERFHVLYVVCSIVLILVTPWPAQFQRYLAPLAPFLVTALGVALAAPQRWLRRVAGVVWVGALLMQAYTLRQCFVQYQRDLPLPGSSGVVEARLFVFDDAPVWRAFFAAVGWLRENAEESAVIATAAPHETWLRTGRKAVMPPFEPDAHEAQRLLETVPASYLILDTFTFVDISRRYARPVIERHPERWERVYSDPDGLVEVFRARR
jgi:hypothetical protein